MKSPLEKCPEKVAQNKNGQADRWCQKLNEIEFAGKANWHMPNSFELQNMNNFESALGSMYDRFGWPVGLSYQSWHSTQGMFRNIRLLEPKDAQNLEDTAPEEARYVSCVVDL
ncbi:hypothetical protein ACN3E9_10815 [Vibrio pectenicida]|uniref:hypothetical protein n=1 Tax=Vibrio pectenicida TaxID=62763 RepID=UPI003B99BD1F